LRTNDTAASFRVAIHGQGLEIDDAVRDLVEHCLWAGLRPHMRRIVAAHVRLWAAPAGDGPAICHVGVELRPSGGLALGETGSNVASAVGRATERLEAALGAQLARQGAAPTQAWLR
jgi:hypothetical protein